MAREGRVWSSFCQWWLTANQTVSMLLWTPQLHKYSCCAICWLCACASEHEVKEEGCVYTSVCLSVRLSTKLLKKLWTDFDEIFRGMGAWRKEQWDFGGHVDYNVDPGITIWIQEYFNGLFIYYCNSYRQPRIKHESLRQTFELSECFLVLIITFTIKSTSRASNFCAFRE